MVFADILHAEIINNKAEHDWSRCVFDEAQCMCTLMVAVGSEEGKECIVCKSTSLGQPVHAALYFDLDVAVVN